MLLGGDLGFLARVVVAAFVVVFAPVVGFLVRRKWRRSVARSEEIKRLLVWASEEIERAEIAAESGYGYDGYSYSNSSVVGIEATDGEPEEKEKYAEVVAPVVEVSVQSPATVQLSRRLQYQCEVCRAPTTTRCARCKAVRYCSGKCQIIHWRQGHKDECHPFTPGDQSHEIGATTSLKPSKVEESEIHNDVVMIGGKHLSDPVETHSGEPAYTDSSLPKSSDREDDAKVEPETFIEEKGSHSNSKFIAPKFLNEIPKVFSNGSSIDASSKAHKDDLSDEHLSIPSPSKTKTGCAGVDIKKPFAETPNLVNCGVNFSSSVKANLMKPKSIDVDGLCAPSTSSSSSSSSSVDGCNESFSEPSTPSSGFWDGTINLTRSRINAFDDNADSCSDDAVGVDYLDSQSTSCGTPHLAGSFLPQSNVSGNCEKKVLSDNPHLPVSEIKKPTYRPSSQIKVNKEGLDTQRSSAISLETPQVDASNSSSEKISKYKGRGEFAASVEAKAGSSFATTPEKLNSKASGQGSISQDSKVSDDILSSNYGRYSVQNVKSVKSDSACELPPSFADSHGNTQNSRNNYKPSVWKVVDQLRASKLARLSVLGIASENVARYNSKCIFPYDVFVKLYHWNKVEMIPCGLMNCGNSCYANVVLQCLTFTPPLTAYFLQGLHSKSCKKADWCFTCEFERLVLKAKEENSPISPSRIISQLQNIGSHLGNGREEDAHEFLRCAIDTMQAGCLKAAGVSASSSLEETTLLGLTFGGYLRSKIECMRCGGKSERHERMMDLTVEIEGDIGTLEEALRQFTHTETLDGENKYQCSRCKSYEKAKKKLRVLEAPNILTIALKRFQSGKFGKLNKMIKFPEILDLAPYMSGTSDKSPIYRLYGVIVHLDIMNASFSGHYVCYVKNTQNKWFKIDDSMVKTVELERVLTKGAYMLLYARCSPRAPRLIRRSCNDSTRKLKDPDSKPIYQSTGPWDASVNDYSNNQKGDESFVPNYPSFKPFHTLFEEDSLSDKSSSLFSEGNSYSTDSSNRDSMGADDFLDQILGDIGISCSSPWRSSSDSETSSSSSSPSPLYLRRSNLDFEAYASECPETSDHYNDSAVSASDNSSRLPNHCEVETARGKGSGTFLCPDSTKRSRKLGSSSSSRETGSSKLGWVNPFESLKSSVTFRRSTRGRSD